MLAKVLKVVLLGACLALPETTLAHDDMGPLTKPIPLKNVDLRLHDGTETDLHAITKGKVTALQLIFTTCTTVCPIQGATFAFLAEDIAEDALPFQLLSISIDANYDTPKELAAWRAQHYDGPGWTIGVTDFVSTHELVDSLIQSISGLPMHDTPVPANPEDRPSETDHHGANVMFVGPDSKLVYRSYDYPNSHDLREILRRLSPDLQG